MPAERPVVVLCKWRADAVPALLAASADLYLVVDRTDVARADFDESLLDEVRSVYRIADFDSIEEMTAIAADLTVRGIAVDRVLSFSEDSQLGASHLRALLGCDDGDRFIAAGARDKRIMKHLVGQAGVAVTEWRSLLPDRPVEDFASFPAVVKPVYGFGTMNTVQVSSAHELADVIAALPDLPRLKSDHLMVERFVEGRELHIDALWHDGEPLFFLVSSYYVPRLAHMETAAGDDRAQTRDGSYVLDSDGQGDLYAKLLDMHRTVNQALAITDSITHLEVFHTPSDRLVFSEIATRPGGGWVPDMISAYLGAPLYDVVVPGLLTGRIDEPKPPYRHLGAVHLRPARGGTVTSVPSDEQIRDTPGLVSWRRMKNVGDRVAFSNTMDWCLVVVLGADTEAEFLHLIDEAEKHLVIEVA